MADTERARDADDINSALWKSETGADFWKSTSADRERRRAGHRRLMAELLPFDPGEEFTFIDLGAGTGAASRTVMDYFHRSRAVLADFSRQMMTRGAEELAAYEGRYRYVELDLAEPGPWPDGIPSPVRAVIASLAVHHVSDERKQQLFREISDRLAPGGWFLNYDPVAPPDPVTGEAWLRAGERRDPANAHKRDPDSPRTEEERIRYENHIRHMSPLEPQLGFLRAAGFEAVDVYWKELDYAIYGGRRPLRGSL